MPETTYRVRWMEDKDGTEQVVTATADHVAGTVTITLAEGQELVASANVGRALCILLTHLVYPVLAPGHVDLTVEYRNRGRWYGGQW